MGIGNQEDFYVVVGVQFGVVGFVQFDDEGYGVVFYCWQDSGDVFVQVCLIDVYLYWQFDFDLSGVVVGVGCFDVVVLQVGQVDQQFVFIDLFVEVFINLGDDIRVGCDDVCFLKFLGEFIVFFFFYVDFQFQVVVVVGQDLFVEVQFVVQFLFFQVGDVELQLSLIDFFWGSGVDFMQVFGVCQLSFQVGDLQGFDFVFVSQVLNVFVVFVLQLGDFVFFQFQLIGQ